MPEGDTIYRTARALERALGGKEVTGFETGLAKLARVNDDSPLVGRVIERAESRGKWCLIYFSGDLILVTHMLMSGSWHLYRSGERWRMGRDKMRVVLRTADWEAVGFNIPVTESLAGVAAKTRPLVVTRSPRFRLQLLPLRWRLLLSLLWRAGRFLELGWHRRRLERRLRRDRRDEG